MKLELISPEKKQEIANLLLNTQDSAYVISNVLGIENTPAVRSVGIEIMGNLFFARENLAVAQMLKNILNLYKTKISASQIALKLKLTKSVVVYLLKKIRNNKIILDKGILSVDNENGQYVEGSLYR